MAYDLNRLANLLHIKTLVENIKEKFTPKSDFNVLGGKVAQMESGMNSMNGKVAQMETGINSMNAYLNELGNDYSSLSGAYNSFKSEVLFTIDARIASVYKPGGSKAFAELPTSFNNAQPPSSAPSFLGKVYNITDAFTTTDLFVEGAGKEYPAGTNVVVIHDGSVYKYDVLAGFVDLSGYVEKGNIATDAEVDELLDELLEA